MSTVMNFLRNALNKFCQQGVSDRANFLKNIAVIGWVLSSLAQTCAVIFNDKIPAKEKRFLIPQEIFDGIANSTLFWLITSKATDFGKSLILKKIVLPKPLSKILSNFVPPKQSVSKMKDAFIAHVSKYGDKAAVKLADNAVEGMGVLAGITGAILSNNIFTPIIRNKLAGICQKKENKRSEEKAPLNPYYGNIDFNKFKNVVTTIPKSTTTLSPTRANSSPLKI